MSMQMVLWKRSGPTKMVIEDRAANSPSGERKPKMTMARGGVLRSTRAGEGSRKASIVKYALDSLYRTGTNSYIIDSALPSYESNIVLVGMTESQFEWSEMLNPEETWGENRSYVECDLFSTLPHKMSTMLHTFHLVGYYYREPGLSMRPYSSILVAMTEQQFQDWCSVRAMQKVNDPRLARREAEDQAAKFSSPWKHGRELGSSKSNKFM